MLIGLLLRLFEACVPPTASYGCEVWGLHGLYPGVSRKGRAALATCHVKLLKWLARVSALVRTSILLCESWGTACLNTCGGGALLVVEHLGCTA